MNSFATTAVLEPIKLFIPLRERFANNTKTQYLLTIFESALCSWVIVAMLASVASSKFSN